MRAVALIAACALGLLAAPTAKAEIYTFTDWGPGFGRGITIPASRAAALPSSPAGATISPRISAAIGAGRSLSTSGAIIRPIKAMALPDTAIART